MKKTLFVGIDFAKANFVASVLLGEDPDPVCLPKSFSNYCCPIKVEKGILRGLFR